MILKEFIELKECKNIRNLYCMHTSLSSLEGIGEYNIQTLYCNSTKIKSIEPVSGCENLISLSCENNDIKSLKGIEKCYKLQNLWFDLDKMECLHETYRILSSMKYINNINVAFYNTDGNSLEFLNKIKIMILNNTLNNFKLEK